MLLADLLSLIFTTAVDLLTVYLVGARYTLNLYTFLLVGHTSVSRR